MHLVLCLVGLPPLPLGLGLARGVGVPPGICLGVGGLASSSPSPSGGGCVEVARSRQTSHSRVSESVTLPHSHRTFHDVRM